MQEIEKKTGIELQRHNFLKSNRHYIELFFYYFFMTSEGFVSENKRKRKTYIEECC